MDNPTDTPSREAHLVEFGRLIDQLERLKTAGETVEEAGRHVTQSVEAAQQLAKLSIEQRRQLHQLTEHVGGLVAGLSAARLPERIIAVERGVAKVQGSVEGLGKTIEALRAEFRAGQAAQKRFQWYGLILVFVVLVCLLLTRPA